MPTVRYDDRSYIVDERRVWLCSGSIHYFRIPRELWRDRLLKAKRAGLNCIDTYVAWNFHEPREGVWDFSGDRDLPAFVALAAELGLYVILRPGPYICAEWDFGGLPAWLASKGGIAYRTSNATYTHYFDKYLAQVLPRLADLQVTRGGNILLIQNENEYIYTALPDRLNYGQFISQLFRRAGFDIPIITCNFGSEPRIPDTIECWNGWNNLVQRLKWLRTFQPNAPMLVTEFWTGGPDAWGGPHRTHDAAEVARRALEILGCGCQFNYYMWHGGTNFEFWGSRLADSDAAYQTASYDYDAPLAEGGGLTKKYYLTRLVNMLASHFGQFIAGCRMDAPGVTAHDAPSVLNISGPAGRFAVITSNGRSDCAACRVSLPDGKDLDVPLGPLGAVAIPVEVRLTPERVLNYANLMPLGLFGDGNLVLHAPAGSPGRICIDGHEIRRTVPADDQPELIEHRGQRILLISSDLAQRTWAVDGALVMGPAFVGENAHDLRLEGEQTVAILSPQGELTRNKVKGARTAPTAPKLGAVARLCVCEEPISEQLLWENISAAKDLAALGIPYGYGWYRLVLQSASAGRRMLYLPECEDRAQVYVNGEHVGVWGRGQGAVREPIPAKFHKGANVLTFLADNLGQPCFGPLGQPKGLYGDVWQGSPAPTLNFKVRPGGEFARRMLPRMLSHLLPQLESDPLWTTEATFSLPKIQPIHLSYRRILRPAVLLCNGRQAGFFTGAGGLADVKLGNELRKGKNTLTLLLWGSEPSQDELDNVAMHLLEENLSAGGAWSYRRWEVPKPGGRVVGKGLPAWYHCRFKADASVSGLFLKISGARKGQIYLNGHNVGRFWTVGPQEHYYLPEPWLVGDNELLIFEEEGLTPSGSSLSVRPAGPYHD